MYDVTSGAWAPRLLAAMARRERNPILPMKRGDWNRVIESRGYPVAFDVRSTPLARVAEDALVLGAVAHEFEGPNALLSIFRSDPKDALPVNRDDLSRSIRNSPLWTIEISPPL